MTHPPHQRANDTAHQEPEHQAPTTRKGQKQDQNQVNHTEKKLIMHKMELFLTNNILKKTKTRQLILEYFLSLNKGDHVSAENIHQDLRKQGYRLALATIYRNIGLLVEAGILEQHNFQMKNAVYEVKYPSMHHDHLVCLDCGDIKEFEDLDIEKKQILISNQLGFELVSHKLELFGRCVQDDCAGAKNS
ncbi:MAG: transcriptional repressor [Proteobacteria bacterium]|nr:transcriptional repressor [Pseudomonadota bacterium]